MLFISEVYSESLKKSIQYSSERVDCKHFADEYNMETVSSLNATVHEILL